MFERPYYLFLLLLLPVLWPWLRGRGPRVCLAFKCAVFAMLVMALADPRVPWPRSRLSVTVVVDVSASMPAGALEQAEGMVRDLAGSSSEAEFRLVTFADYARLQGVPRRRELVSLGPREPDSGEGAGMATDLEKALELALSTFPAGGARRILLISDGNETRGHALSAAVRARERGVRIYTVGAGGAARLPLRLESVAVPQQVFSGERFAVSLALEAPRSPRAPPARIALLCQGKQIGSALVQLHGGSNQVDVDARITGSGVSLLEARILAGGEERTLFSQAITVRRPRVLYVSGGPEPPRYLPETLKRAQIDVELARVFPAPAPPERWDAVILDNYPDHVLPAAEHQALEKYVSVGGGLVFIAGQANSRLAEQPREGLEKLLPVRADPDPAPQESTAVVLVLDKSASMDGAKMAMTREAGRAAIALLRPTDKVGVIAFDSAFRWVVPMSPAGDMARISQLIESIVADGGTSIYPALEAGFQAIRQESAGRKHIILMTDGWSTPGEFGPLAQQAAREHVTISTLGVGQEVNRQLLETLAREARGKSYFVEQAERIPQIISNEVRQLSVSSIKERPFYARRARPVEFTDGVDFEHAPRLLGFVKARPRPGSETILKADSGEPLLVRWQYGLGRVTAFLSDARNRWAAEWLRWEGYGALWPQIIRDVCHRSRTVRAGVRPGEREGEAVVYYDVVADAAFASAWPEHPRVAVAAAGEPDSGEQPRSVKVEETAPGHYEARIPAGERGLYRILLGSGEMRLPEAGFYYESEELSDRDVNTALLKEISRLTGGRYRPSMEQLLDPEGSEVRERRALWPYLLALALLLNLLELAWRKGFLARLRPAAAVPEPARNAA
ncbi:MAG: VWA domain-containing protein [Acidobacteria bacterium]|nr:VWA domain-containing protein [Acidobacteriota bacterium]